MITFQKSKPFYDLSSDQLIKKNKVTKVFFIISFFITLGLIGVSYDIKEIIVYLAASLFTFLSIILFIISSSEKIMIFFKRTVETLETGSEEVIDTTKKTKKKKEYKENSYEEPIEEGEAHKHYDPKEWKGVKR